MGALVDGSLEWLAGGFYLKNKPKGPNSISYYLYQPSAEDAAANPALDFVSPFLRQNSEAVIKEESKAIFLSLSQDLGSMVEGLRSEERSVGEECGSTCRSRGSAV